VQRLPRVLAWLAALDRTRVFLGALAVGVLGMFLPGVLGGLLLLAVVAALAALLRHTWAVTPAGHRAARVIVLAGLAAFAIAKLA
jgi:hypothetical protein